MTTNTPTFAFPYPDPGDPVANGDDTIKALAQRVELVLSGGDSPEAFLAAQQNIAAAGTANLGSITIPQTYRRRSLVLALHGTPAAAAAVSLLLVPNFADPRITDPGYPLRQYTGANSLAQVAYWHFQVGIGAAATTQFNLTISAGTGLNSVRARAWVI